ncbi:MAG: zincin-like metallopeptidase domain-containing protein, partial [Clostridiales bacterium]
MANKVYDYVTQEIIRKIKEEKIVPWQKPWIGEQVNYVTQKHYRGVNTLLLKKSGEYLTFSQIKEKGGELKKGSKGEMVIFFKPLEKEKKDKKSKEKYIVLRYYKVFHLDDVEGLESKYVKKINNPIKEAENIINNYEDKPRIVNIEQNRAYYDMFSDKINVPLISNHKTSEDYYSTLFHEAIHSTGYKERIGRFKENEIMNFGSDVYSKEELIAEIGAAMLCGIAGIIDKTINNSVSYLDSWIKQLENDSTLIVKAAAAAQ